ncbi:hypothetical protein BDZ45DRAFT_675417 [Acephala macrosclerotiorum]|nr:hypothetical protein BDZ45DRAFT_675417 [Acephala macrosclerotiorum]
MSQSHRNNASLAPHRPHILVIGGTYGGLSTIVNLLNLSKGNKQLRSPIQLPELDIEHDPQPVITLLDGEEIVCGKVIYTNFKHQARTEFLPRDVVDDNGFVKVRSTYEKLIHLLPAMLSFN